MVGIAEVGAPISLDGVAVHPDCWCICLCYLHFASENPEDGGKMHLLVLTHLGCARQSPESHKMVVCVVCFLTTLFTYIYTSQTRQAILALDIRLLCAVVYVVY